LDEGLEGEARAWISGLFGPVLAETEDVMFM
jgi:hypothetical protein